MASVASGLMAGRLQTPAFARRGFLARQKRATRGIADFLEEKSKQEYGKPNNAASNSTY